MLRPDVDIAAGRLSTATGSALDEEKPRALIAPDLAGALILRFFSNKESEVANKLLGETGESVGAETRGRWG